MDILLISSVGRLITELGKLFQAADQVGVIDVDVPTVIAIIAILTAIIQAIYQRWVADARRDIRYEHRFTQLEAKVDLYWKSVESQLADQVHHPITPETDELLEKIPTGTMTIADRMRLRQLLIGQLCAPARDPANCTAINWLIGIQSARIAEAQMQKILSPKVLRTRIS